MCCQAHPACTTNEGITTSCQILHLAGLDQRTVNMVRAADGPCPSKTQTGCRSHQKPTSNVSSQKSWRNKRARKGRGGPQHRERCHKSKGNMHRNSLSGLCGIPELSAASSVMGFMFTSIVCPGIPHAWHALADFAPDEELQLCGQRLSEILKPAAARPKGSHPQLQQQFRLP